MKVLIDGSSSDLSFSYLIPDGMEVAPGSRVLVPLRGREAVGTVMAVEEVDTSVLSYNMKPVRKVVGSQPFLTPDLLKLAEWISGYYMCSIESVYRTMLPKPARGKEDKSKKAKQVRLPAGVLKDSAAGERIPKTAKKQVEAFEVLREAGEGGFLLSEMTGVKGFGRSTISGLEDKGLVEVVDVVVSRDPTGGQTFVASQPLTPNPEQQVVLDKIKKVSGKNLEKAPKPILLYGVTGSGKTEVYLQSIQHVLEQGMGAIVLVPEIALTPQTANRFKQRFADIQDQVAILHSSLSEGERHDEWKKILNRKARIVIGARSAIFSPIENLGLIVVDEEHENSYKQDTNPRYQARDLAVVRGVLEKCPVVLGSATPSLESWKNVESGKYDLAEMLLRVDDRKLPLIRIIDMKLETRKQGGGLTILSSKLREAIEARLADGEQTILFLNRRGFSRSMLCPQCGYVANCRHCASTMTLHQHDDKLVCHICGFSQLPPRKCPECGAKDIVNSGFGTERVESVLKEFFKGARVARIDTDTMRKKNALRDTLDAFRAKKIDIIIGTQMIAKGLHFPNVTLVGMLNADVGLHIPDIRAGERTFQLLTQVAGRAGRGELEGEVVVQTFTPHHPAIQFGRHHDFIGFAEQELALRKMFGHPPYVHMTLITARSKHQERAEFSLKTLHLRLARDLPEEIVMTEPLPSPLVKSHDQWRFQVVMKAVNPRKIATHIRTVMKDMTFPEDVIVTFDMDCYQMS
ncbi:MAG: primosomal protein N' [Verrucomicrobiales bacterium]|nr:primosomal protein N' [Verrucomicrobiales bacterium]